MPRCSCCLCWWCTGAAAAEGTCGSAGGQRLDSRIPTHPASRLLSATLPTHSPALLWRLLTLCREDVSWGQGILLDDQRCFESYRPTASDRNHTARQTNANPARVPLIDMASALPDRSRPQVFEAPDRRPPADRARSYYVTARAPARRVILAVLLFDQQTEHSVAPATLGLSRLAPLQEPCSPLGTRSAVLQAGCSSRSHRYINKKQTTAPAVPSRPSSTQRMCSRDELKNSVACSVRLARR